MSGEVDGPVWHGFPNVTISACGKLDPLDVMDSSSLIKAFHVITKPSVRCLDTALSPSADSLNGSITYEKHEWRETWLRFQPLSGILAFFVAILSTLASLGVLAGSDGQRVDAWPTPPATYIAIFTAIGNAMMRYAAVQGVAIAWWSKALHGSSVRELHYDWRAGTSFLGALLAGRHMGWLGIASILSCVVILLDGPLLQRSSTVVTASHQGPTVSLDFTMVPELPTGYTGEWYHDSVTSEIRWSPAFNDTIPSPEGSFPNNVFCTGNNLFAPLMPLWATDGTIHGTVSGCPGKCKAQMIAPALATTSCVRFRQPLMYAAPWDFLHPFDKPRAPPLGHNAFVIDTSLDVSGEMEKINTITAFPSHNCDGDLEVEICSLVSAVGKYDIIIENDQMTLGLDAAANPEITRLSSNAAVQRDPDPDGHHPSTLAGLVGAAWLIWNTYLFAVKENTSLTLVPAGAPANLLFQRGVYNETSCPAFVDPKETYRGSLNQLMVLLGVTAARGVSDPRLDTLDPDLPINATTIGHITGVRNVFDTNYWFFLGAALIEFICICLIAPTYWGWWRIGRPVSFSPLEIATAFEAPILRDINSNSTGVEIAKSCDDQRIQYGSILASAGRTKLAFSQRDAASWPRHGSVIEL